MKEEYKCPKCNGTGIVKEKNRVCHVCYECLKSNRFDSMASQKTSG